MKPEEMPLIARLIRATTDIEEKRIALKAEQKVLEAERVTLRAGLAEKDIELKSFRNTMDKERPSMPVIKGPTPRPASTPCTTFMQKLDMNKANEIRRLYGTPMYTTYEQLANAFGVSKNSIGQIITNKSYR